MLELKQASRTGNPQRVSFWSLLSKAGSKPTTQQEAGSSLLYRCNNCDLEAPIEDLRVPITYPSSYLVYRNRSERPPLFHDMMLCADCRTDYRNWINTYDHTTMGLATAFKKGNRIFPLINIALWSREYWKRKRREAQANSSLSVPRRQVSSCTETLETTPLPQDLC